MKRIKITCSSPAYKCHKILEQNNPELLSVLHEQNNHLLIMKQDYDKDGHVKGNIPQ